MLNRELGKLTSSAIGLGCMPMSWGYGVENVDPVEVRATLREAIDLGVTLLDTSDIYGPFTNEELLGEEVVKAGFRDRVLLATKFGFLPKDKYKFDRDASPAHVKRACDASLTRLQTDVIDLYQLHRTDPKVPIEETWMAMVELVKAGKVRYLGLSEVTLDELKRAHAIYPVTTLQSELSLWTRDAIETGILQWTVDNQVGFLAYSPLGRGYLTGVPLNFNSEDFRFFNPRFTPEAMANNQVIIDKISHIAERLEISNAQLALAWTLAISPNVVPIPGTKQRKWLRQNVASIQVTLTPEVLAELDNLPKSVAPRY